uniref:Ubiquitin-like-conjugating enzyme ATG3 n=1 Tax=Ascaris lumbricoides TaxID=6252 RepID=A0A0M3IIT7_ASCLU
MDALVKTMKSAALNVGEMLTPILRESKFKETGVLTPEEFIIAGDHLVIFSFIEGNMDALVKTMKSAALNVGEMLTPILRESKFKETGVLTPEEFIIAGDHLVHHCPTWSWAKAADASRTKTYLPDDKQFLITRNVPCYRRCIEMDYDPTQEKVLTNAEMGVEGFDGADDDGGWVDTHHFAPESALQKPVSMDEPATTEPEVATGNASADDDGPAMDMESFIDSGGLEQDDPNRADDDGPAMDMESFIDSGGLEQDDPNRFIPTNRVMCGSQGDTIIHTRTYDLHITYDKYYQVPRLWLSGYDEAKKPLSVEKMNEDFSQDHANKTITIETHPHLHNTQMASIHPCRHAEVMKRLIEQLAESGKELTVEHYLLIFLKFVQVCTMKAVIPTIEYDYTRSIQL